MTFETAQRLTEILLAFALLQQTAEHLYGAVLRRAPWAQVLYMGRLFFCLLLFFGLFTAWALAGLAVVAVVMLHRFNGPYNGGSDRMGLLILFCLLAAHLAPMEIWRHVALGYLALQLTLSYFIAGWVKLVNADWRSGRALRDVFQFSAYPVAENLRGLAQRPRLLFAASWAVMLFELVFPFALLHPLALAGALVLAALFHLSNALFFGLNRFFWVWIAAYPALIWFQHRVFAG